MQVQPNSINDELKDDKRFHPSVIGVILLVFMLSVAIFISYMEGITYFNSFYACFITYSTIGFGDIDIYVREMIILSGDRSPLVEEVRQELALDKAYGELVPEQKYELLLKTKEDGELSAYVGDGINDSVVMAGADISMAMGQRGSDILIENADVVIENDDLSSLGKSLRISRLTQNNVYQNLIIALVVKILVMTMATMGMAHLWEAIFADVGVALLVILNAYMLKNRKM